MPSKDSGITRHYTLGCPKLLVRAGCDLMTRTSGAERNSTAPSGQGFGEGCKRWAMATTMSFSRLYWVGVPVWDWVPVRQLQTVANGTIGVSEWIGVVAAMAGRRSLAGDR